MLFSIVLCVSIYFSRAVWATSSKRVSSGFLIFGDILWKGNWEYQKYRFFTCETVKFSYQKREWYLIKTLEFIVYKNLTLFMLGKISADILKYFSLFFFFIKNRLTSLANCLLETICMERQSLFSEKNYLGTVCMEVSQKIVFECHSLFSGKTKKNISKCHLLNLPPFLSLMKSTAFKMRFGQRLYYLHV